MHQAQRASNNLSTTDQDNSLPPGRVNYRAWLLTVLGWDGLLPICIATAPYLTQLVFRSREATEVVGTLLPILAFFIRVPVGGSP